MESKTDQLSRRPKSAERHTLWTLLDSISAEHARQGARITELRAKIAALTLEPVKLHACGDCGVTFRLALHLQWHRYTRHDGPLPDDEVAAERAAGFERERQSQAPPLVDRRSEPYDAPQPSAAADTPTTGAVHASSHARASVSVSDGSTPQTTTRTPAPPAAP